MDNELVLRIDELIEECEDELAGDIIRLVNIKSVKDTPKPGAPFGEGAKMVLDTVLEMGETEGFFTCDYNVGVVSLALKEGQPDLGIWAHGDVVPEGDGWDFKPYDAVLYKGCIIGRGATDNKGQLASVFHLFKIFRKLGIVLKYNPALYVGSNEETGMKDMIGLPDNPEARGFINACTPPRLSLVPDGGFPVGCGGKGSVQITFKSKTKVNGYSIIAGQNDFPGYAFAYFDKADIPDDISGCTVKKGEKTEISTFSIPRHGTNPDPDGNMITALCSALLSNSLVPEEDRYILDFYKKVSLDTTGAMFGIDVVSDKMQKPLTLVTKKIDFEEGYPELTIDIRYPIEITYGEIIERVGKTAEECGFVIKSSVRGVDPYMLDAESDIVKKLTEVSNEVTKNSDVPYIVGGGTYAHRLPNAYVYGMNGNLPPEDFPKGHGGAHGIDEAVSLARLKRAMKIYARALLALNDMEW